VFFIWPICSLMLINSQHIRVVFWPSRRDGNYGTPEADATKIALIHNITKFRYRSGLYSL
jgi:hypothetical protein